jgi:hypothetical protein
LSSDAAWADYDKNGHLDIFVTVINGADNRLYRSYPPESKILQSAMSAKASASHHEAPAIVQSRLQVNRGSHRLLPLLPHTGPVTGLHSASDTANQPGQTRRFFTTDPHAPVVGSTMGGHSYTTSLADTEIRTIPYRQWSGTRSIDPYDLPELTASMPAVADEKAQQKLTNIGVTQTYYLYSAGGQLMAEYDQSGSCLKEFIYLNGRLLAEYLPQADLTYYYLSDQIGSTRFITNDAGEVVYSAIQGPYGEDLRTWVRVASDRK